MSDLSKFLKNFKPSINLNFKFGGKKKPKITVSPKKPVVPLKWYSPFINYLIRKLESFK